MGLMQLLGGLFGESGGPEGDPSLANPADTPAGMRSRDFLTRLSDTIFGLSDSELTPEELSARKAKRREAASMANQAMRSPGTSFMGPPSGGEQKIGSLLSTITGLFGAG